ncbi:putative exported protein [Collimonas fungivorans]|uniref:Putative exported protein n=1 Tax=Collimonas fungivorans TaxID=158899 RepID=A0A127PHR5_9BURK|nr:PP0621 family protein [Collimonas fungivorans]AMO97338.1 putative exported protein [Collimonas fungivorans]
MKLIILIVVVLAVIVWLQRLKKNLTQSRPAPGEPTFNSGAAASAAGDSPQAEAIVACAHCGMHFPASEALADASGAVFCSAEHRRLHST